MSSDEPVIERARSLLGAHLIRDDVVVRVTEVEAYGGASDPASHAYRGPTPRTEIMFGPPGHLYVYFSYGMHWCANVVVGREGHASAVLLRAASVEAGMDQVRLRRGDRMPDRDLARGPARLTACLGITGADNGADLCDPGGIQLVARTGPEPTIVAGPRVGVSQAADVPWRLWIEGEPTVSAYRRSPRALL